MTELPTSLIVLEYLKVLLGWPVVVSVLAGLFMWRFQNAITALIGRITGIAFPGGKVDIPQYNPESANELKSVSTETPTPAAQASVISEHIEKRLGGLEKDFDAFYTQTLLLNTTIIGSLLDVIWAKTGNALFAGKSRPESISETIKLLGNRIDQRVIGDVENVQKSLKEYFTVKKVNRPEFLKAIKTSELIIDYFRRIVNTK